MRRKIKKLLAVMLALALIISLVNVDQFSVTAESPEVQTETRAADSSKAEKTSQTKSEDQKSASEAKSEETDQSSVDTGTPDETASSSSDSETGVETDSQSKSDTETTEGTEEQESEAKSTEVAGETEAAEGDSQTTVTDKNASSGTNSSKKENTEADSESNKKTDVSEESSEKEETEESQSDNQNEFQKDEVQNSENSEDGSEDDQLSYEQTARKALSRMGVAEAFDADEEIPSDYYTIVGVSDEDIPENYTLTAGDISVATVPEIEGYDFVNATISTDEGDIEVNAVGMLIYDDTTYVYYTTEGSSTGLAAMVLGAGEKITLNYEVHRDTYIINYEVQGGEHDDAIDVDDIYGTDRPTSVKNGDSYAFRVTIPRGYTATVLVNGQSQGQLGVEPEYGIKADNANVIETKGEPTVLTLSGTYEIENVSDVQTVKVALTRRTDYSFTASLWTGTVYASGRAAFGSDLSNIQADQVEGENAHEIWRFTTNTQSGSDRRSWILDSLQINGTKLNLPYGDYSQNFQAVSAETILPSGTVVKVTLESIAGVRGYDSRTYSLSVSNCYEDITITGGNLFSSTTWNEIIVDRLTGVEFQINDRQVADGVDFREPEDENWTTMEQSQPFGVGDPMIWEKVYDAWFPWEEDIYDWTYERGKNYLLDEDMRFKLDAGYVNPKVSYGTAGGIGEGANGDLSGYLSNVSGPDSDGWYKFSVSSQNGNSITLLRIEAELGQYNVVYDKGDIPSDSVSEGNPALPDADNGQYNIVDKNQIIVSSVIPTDSTDKYAFQYWTLDGYVDEEGNSIEIRPNQVLDLKTVLETMEEHGQTPGETLTLKAHWVEATSAEQITYTVQFIKDNDEANPAWSENYQAPSGSTIILDLNSEEVQTFLSENPGYVVDENQTERLYSDIRSGQELNIYFIKNTTTVTLEKSVTGNMGDKDQKFTFEVSINDTDQGDVELADTEKQEFTATIGSTFTFAETEAQGYEVTVAYTDSTHNIAQSVEDTDNDGYYEVIVTENMHITVTNHKQVNPPSGLAGGSDSWMILLGAAAVLAVTSGGFYLRRKKARAHD